MDPPFDPADRTVSDLREALKGIDDPEALEGLREAEESGDNRTTALEAIEERLEEIGPQQPATPSDGSGSVPGSVPTEAETVRDVLEAALRYPWNGGQAAVTLIVGGILTLLSPLVIPGLIVLGYGLEVVEVVMAGEDRPPTFRNWRQMFVDGIKAVIVLIGYVVIPLIIGTGVIAVIAGAAGFRFRGGSVLNIGDPQLVGIAFVFALLVAGLALVVSYLAPAALVHLGRTGRLGAAFEVSQVRRLARADDYGAAWLLALAVFASAAVVLAVLNAAAIGVIVSGFVTFYAFVAMAHLYTRGAAGAGFDLEASNEDSRGENSE